MTFEVTQGHWYWCHSIRQILFPVSLLLFLRLMIFPVMSQNYNVSWVIHHAWILLVSVNQRTNLKSLVSSIPNVWLGLQSLSSNQRIFTTDCIAGGGFITRENLMWYCQSGTMKGGCSSRADAVIDFFAAYTTTVTQCFSTGRKTSVYSNMLHLAIAVRRPNNEHVH